MTIDEIQANGVIYRGPLRNSSPANPWKITVYRASHALSTSGGRVGKSWQTFGCYSSEAKCRAAMDEIWARSKLGAK